MSWYAAAGRRRAGQIVADVGVAAWVLCWILFGRAVHQLVVALAGPARSLDRAGAQFQESVRAAAGQVRDVPLVGGQLSGALEGISDSGGSVSSAGGDLAATIERLGLVLGIVAAGGPILAVLVPWAAARYRFARRARAAQLFLRGQADLDLFALRALAAQPMRSLARVSTDPAGAWRRGDPMVTRQLAMLELRELGVGLPPGAATPLPREGT